MAPKAFKPAKSLRARIDFYAAVETMTEEAALSHWKACAWLRIPCRIWRVFGPGWVKMTDEIAEVHFDPVRFDNAVIHFVC